MTDVATGPVPAATCAPTGRFAPVPPGPASGTRWQCWGCWWRRDAGSAAVEVTLLTPLLIMLLVFVAVVVHRGVHARLRIDDAAHQAARAASIERTGPAAAAAARSTAAAALASAGLSCRDLQVDIDTSGWHAGGVVRVALMCTVDFGDARLLAVPGEVSVSGEAVEPIDSFRSTGDAAPS